MAPCGTRTIGARVQAGVCRPCSSGTAAILDLRFIHASSHFSLFHIHSSCFSPTALLGCQIQLLPTASPLFYFISLCLLYRAFPFVPYFVFCPFADCSSSFSAPVLNSVHHLPLLSPNILLSSLAFPIHILLHSLYLRNIYTILRFRFHPRTALIYIYLCGSGKRITSYSKFSECD